MRQLRLLAMVGLAGLLAMTANAAGWGALDEGDCRFGEGKREHKAKVWTLPLVDDGPVTECRRMTNEVRGVERRPDRCDHLIAGIVYGVWYVRDETCGVAALPRPIPGDGIPDLRDPNAPIIEIDKIILAIADAATSWVVPLVQPHTEPMVDKMAAAWNTMAEKADIIALTQLAVDLQGALLSSRPHAVEAREAFFARNDKRTIQALSKMPEFNAVKDKVEKSGLINSFSLTLIELDGAKALGGNIDVNANIGIVESTGKLGYMPGFGLGVSAGASSGVDIAMVNIGFWTDTLDDLQGNTHGITFAMKRKEIGYTSSVHFGYPDDCRFMYDSVSEFLSSFKGFTVGPQTPTSVEVEYMRAHLAAFRRAKNLDVDSPDFWRAVALSDRPATSIQPCWF